jgi:hypothetical protein
VLFLRRPTLVAAGQETQVLDEEVPMQQIEAEPQLVPFTTNRALTELAQSRRQVEAARGSLELALQIIEGLEDDRLAAPTPVLRGVLGQLEEAEATLWEAAP